MTRKILVVEDDEATGDYIAKGLDESGYLVDRARNGRDGLFHATDGEYAAVILDRMLPGMDGLAVLAAMRAAGVETPVIILSALGSPDERVNGLKAGSDDYLVKPFAFSELLARLDVDADFAAAMIPHHQGAIDMARAELRYGKDKQLRAMAQGIIGEQRQQIVTMRAALKQVESGELK